MLNQRADLNSTHIDSNVRPNENKNGNGYQHLNRTETWWCFTHQKT